MVSRIAQAGFAVLLTLGLWVSFCYSRSTWRPDSDMGSVVLILRGVGAHGLPWLASWMPTTDNWIGSLLPVLAPAYALFGLSGGGMIVAGWLIFVGCAALCGLLASQVAGRRAILPVAALVLFANAAAGGETGFLTYPVTHNISLLFGLAALSLSLHAVAQRRIWPIAAACVLLLLGGLSDPWLMPAFLLPLLLGSATIAVAPGTAARDRLVPAIASLAFAVTVWLTWRRLFGLLPFLPRQRLIWTDPGQMATHAGWLVQIFGAMFNIIPWQRSAGAPGVLFGAVAFAGVWEGLVLLAASRWRSAPPALRLLMAVTMLSAGGVVCAFLFQVLPDGIWIGRFFQNVYVLPLLLGGALLTRNWSETPLLARTALCVWAALFAISGARSHSAAWLHGLPHPPPSETRDIIDSLNAAGLTRGYGDYWGAEAHAVTWLSGGAITLRPVDADLALGRFKATNRQVSRRWYDPALHPDEGKGSFLILTQDSAGCLDLPVCDAMAVRQFGPPSRRIGFNHGLILVWPREILPQLEPISP